MKEITHVMLNKKLSEKFKCENAILKEIPYVPKILILGTFNPDTPRTNHADFFYGRNYFWTGFMNLFIHKNVKLLNSRMPKNGKPSKALNPSLEDILQLCKKLELTFADLIIGVLHKDNPEYHMLDNDNVCYENKTFNLIQDDKKGQIEGLAQLDKLNQVRWNTKNIINYLRENPQIETIYFTRQAKGIWKKQWDEIKNDNSIQGRTFTNIFTPSGQGKPVLNSMVRLLNHWVHNTNPNFGRFDNKWLKNKGVDDLNIFKTSIEETLKTNK